MNERTTLEIIAPTVEEALAQGLAQLGLPADAVSVEVLDSGNKGLFGLGGRQVRVRLTVHNPGDEQLAPRAEAPATEKRPAPAPARPRKEAKPPRSRQAAAPAPSPAASPAAPSAVPAAAPVAPRAPEVQVHHDLNGGNDHGHDHGEAGRGEDVGLGDGEGLLRVHR